MSIADVEHAAHEVEHQEHHPGYAEAGHHPDSFYVKIALLLVVLTAMEVTISYVHIGWLFLPVLLILMSIKFVMVALFFMHLRFDSKWFNMAFWTGLLLAIFVYCAALATFKFFLQP